MTDTSPKPVPAEGNASNTPPHGRDDQPGESLIDEKAEKYIKEAGNIEDMPDPEEDQEAIDEMEKE